MKQKGALSILTRVWVRKLCDPESEGEEENAAEKDYRDYLSNSNTLLLL